MSLQPAVTQTESNMNKVNIREAKTATTACALGHPDMAARILSACIRAALRPADQRELFALAAQLGIVNESDFIVPHQLRG